LVAGFRLVDAANKHLVKMSDINHKNMFPLGKEIT
jgi:hypothetical protein